MTGRPYEVLYWSIAFPGFGQILNGRFLKGLTFIALEFLINANSMLNQAIVFSFWGDIEQAIAITNYQWLMFYPCIYVFAMWDAFKEAGAGTEAYSFLPAVFGAYGGTIGVIFSPVYTLFNVKLGPVWLGILGVVTGALIGLLVMRIVKKL